MNEIQLVVFDLAGTTVRDDGSVAECLAAALQAHGLSVSNDELSAVRGLSKRDAIARLIPAGADHALRRDKIHAWFRERLADRYSGRGIEQVDGAERVFQWLRSRGIRVALNTGFDGAITELLLGSLQWDLRTVDAIVCGDDVREGRPAPYLIFHAMEASGTTDVRQVANIGDTVMDLEAGSRAGVRWNIGVLSGAHDQRRLETAHHTHLLGSIADLTSLWS